jgi:ATP-dependent helicase HrpA
LASITDERTEGALSADSRSRTPVAEAPSVRSSVIDANEQLGRLVRRGFVLAAGLDRLPDLDRYVKALAYRLDHLSGHVPRDQQRMAEVRPLEQRYRALVDRLDPSEATQAIADMEWQLEELRVALFAQPLASGGVSVKKVTRSLAALGA